LSSWPPVVGIVNLTMVLAAVGLPVGLEPKALIGGYGNLL
jgi:hypothetical protein